MWKLTKIFIFFVGAMLTTLYLSVQNSSMPMYQWKFFNNESKSSNSKEDYSLYLVYSNSCVIRFFDAFSPEVKPFVKIKKFNSCPSYTFITYEKGRTIFVNNSYIEGKYPGGIRNCLYKPFIKKTENDDSIAYLRSNNRYFKHNITALHNFVEIECFNRHGKVLERNTHAFYIRQKLYDTKQKILRKSFYQRDIRQPNVFIVFLESTSALNFERHMHKTRSYLLNALGAVQLYGLNKIAINTFPNLVGYMLRITKEEAKISSQEFLDKYHFIWKNFSAIGYTDFQIEDDSVIAAYNYNKKGFNCSPSRYYMRPYMMRTERILKNRRICGYGSYLPRIMGREIFKFMEAYADVPKFVTMFVCNLMHDNPNGLSMLDISLLHTLQRLEQQRHLENTIIMVLGDHGSRYGSIRNTYQGRLEENLPAFYIALPRWLSSNQPNLLHSLKVNAHRLVSNFDVFATLMHIADIAQGHMEPKQKTKYGLSLFSDIPNNRSCADLQIPSIFCACTTYKPINVSLPILQKISAWVIAEINKKLNNVKSLCNKLVFHQVMSASTTHSNNNFHLKLRHVTVDYFLSFKVMPGGGIFEANVRHSAIKSKFALLGPVIRTSKQGNQGKCLTKLAKNGTYLLEPYCFCKDISKSKKPTQKYKHI